MDQGGQMMFRALGHVAGSAMMVCLLAFLVVAQAAAGDMMPVNVGPDKVAIKGYDSVAYFTDGQPTRGSADFAHDWQGAQWWFTNAEHRDLFSTDPEKYAPRFGGFCAMGMSLGMHIGADPEAWAIVDDKLYLNSDRPTLAEFMVDTPSHLAKAEAFWKTAVQGN
jgi:YHS domain-containing protein